MTVSKAFIVAACLCLSGIGLAGCKAKPDDDGVSVETIQNNIPTLAGAVEAINGDASDLGAALQSGFGALDKDIETKVAALTPKYDPEFFICIDPALVETFSQASPDVINLSEQALKLLGNQVKACAEDQTPCLKTGEFSAATADLFIVFDKANRSLYTSAAGGAPTDLSARYKGLSDGIDMIVSDVLLQQSQPIGAGYQDRLDALKRFEPVLQAAASQAQDFDYQGDPLAAGYADRLTEVARLWPLLRRHVASRGDQEIVSPDAFAQRLHDLIVDILASTQAIRDHAVVADKATNVCSGQVMSALADATEALFRLDQSLTLCSGSGTCEAPKFSEKTLMEFGAEIDRSLEAFKASATNPHFEPL